VLESREYWTFRCVAQSLMLIYCFPSNCTDRSILPEEDNATSKVVSPLHR
jgi:hypothetical protein